MKAAKITAKIRDAVPVCIYCQGEVQIIGPDKLAGMTDEIMKGLRPGGAIDLGAVAGIGILLVSCMRARRCLASRKTSSWRT